MKNCWIVLLAVLPPVVLALAFPPALSAQGQSNRAYGGGPAWWNAGWGGVMPWEDSYENPNGWSGVLNKSGAVQAKDHPFFEPLGTNGRACITCHQPVNAMSISAATARQRWVESGGGDPLFAAVDGSNCPDQAQAEAKSHSLLLDRGLFRMVLPLPAQADFRIEVVSDPNRCNSAPGVISVYRRPRMTANLDFVLKGASGSSVFMADGREPSLESQASNAALAHEQAAGVPDSAKLKKIVEFETQIFAAQTADVRGGLLDEAKLGTQHLEKGSTARLSQVSFDGWRVKSPSGIQAEFRTSAARGSDLFFGRKFRIEGVPQLAAGNGTCSTCHVSGTTRWMNIGTTTHEKPIESKLGVFKVSCNDGRVMYTEDPGRGLISGKCDDIGAIVLQQFRGLSARAPYFANGSAADLEAVVEFYERRFHIGLTTEEKRDLVNFMRVL